MVAGQTISLESTTYPGTTEEEVVTRVEAARRKVGESVFVVYSPEREDPGNPKFSATNIPKVVGGHTAACLEAGVALYGAAFDQVVPVSSTQVAEMSKLLENIYRSINIGLVNELKSSRTGWGSIFGQAVPRGAPTKSFRVHALLSGTGPGGHCIPMIDSTSPGRHASLASTPGLSNWPARSTGLARRLNE